MGRVFLISCVKDKKQKAAQAQNIYQSSLFNKASQVAELESDEWYILSAKHGLLSKDKVIEPYDQTLHNFSKNEKRKWAKDVYEDLETVLNEDDSVTMLAGEVYRKHLLPLLKENGYPVSVPMAGKQLGYQLRWLNNRMDTLKKKEHLEDLYSLLERLRKGAVGPIKMKETHGRLDWPKKGVYFYFEPGECRDSDTERQRVVRVGTHAVSAGSSATLWNRLRTHRGTENGSGNHRASIFRLHIGEALMQREGLKVPTWAQKSIPKEIPEVEANLERMVSEIIGEMEVICIEVDDQAGPNSDRAFIEQNAIALLSGNEEPYDSPSSDWLGHDSTREAIRVSGLWNVDHVTDEYDDRFLQIFERYVKSTIGESEPPDGRIAPDRDKAQVTFDRFMEKQ